MKKIGIFYGSTTGNTKDIAHRIAARINVAEADVRDVSDASPSDVADYDVLLLGSSTWGSGELQDDWYDFVAGLEALDLEGKSIGLFGCGDDTMSDTFCGALGVLYGRLKRTGARFIGKFGTDGYSFDDSAAMVDGEMVGLAIDEINHADLTDRRIAVWCDKILSEM